MSGFVVTERICEADAPHNACGKHTATQCYKKMVQWNSTRWGCEQVRMYLFGRDLYPWPFTLKSFELWDTLVLPWKIN